MDRIDKFLFNKAKTPCYSKEWWYFVLSPNMGEQLVFWYLRSNLKADELRSRETDCLWYYKQDKITDLGKKISSSDFSEGMRISSIKRAFEFNGKYPDYSLKLVNNDETILEGLTNSIHSSSAELVHVGLPLIDVRVYNDILKFNGKFLEEIVDSNLIIQRAVVNGPFLPWRWSRITFEEGSILEFSKIFMPKFNIDFANYSYFHDSERGITTNLGPFNIKQDDDYWQIKSKNLELVLESYAKNLTTFKSLGSFTYEVNLARTKKVRINTENKKLTEKELGTGYGPFENANGFVI